MTKQIFILTALFSLFLGKINAQNALTLEQSIEIALENNRNVRQPHEIFNHNRHNRLLK